MNEVISSRTAGLLADHVPREEEEEEEEEEERASSRIDGGVRRAVDDVLPAPVFHLWNLLGSELWLNMFYFICFASVSVNVILFLMDGGKSSDDVPYLILLILSGFLIPLEVNLLREVLESSEFQLKLMLAHKRNNFFRKSLLLVSSFNLFIFLAAVALYAMSNTSPYTAFNTCTMFFLYILLPFCVIVAIMLLEAHRQDANYFIETIESKRLGSKVMSSEEDIDVGIISNIREEYILLHTSFRRCSQRHGLFLSFAAIISCLIVIYLIWSYYSYVSNFLSISGFLALAFIVCIEMFIWHAATNDSGHKVSQCVSDFCLFTRGASSQPEFVEATHLVACLGLSKLEMRGVGSLVIRFQLVVTITVGFLAAVVPRILLKKL